MVLKNFKLVLAILIITVSLKAIDKDQLHSLLNDKYASIESFQAQIRQTAYYEEIGIERESNGDLYYNNDLLSLRYYDPEIEQILFHENKIDYYQASENTLYQTYADSSLVSLNVGYFINNYWDDENITILSEENKQYQVRLVLTEENKLSNIQEVIFTINGDNFLVHQIKYADDSSNWITLDLINIKINKEIPKERWLLDINEETKIVNYR